MQISRYQNYLTSSQSSREEIARIFWSWINVTISLNLLNVEYTDL